MSSLFVILEAAVTRVPPLINLHGLSRDYQRDTCSQYCHALACIYFELNTTIQIYKIYTKRSAHNTDQGWRGCANVFIKDFLGNRGEEGGSRKQWERILQNILQRARPFAFLFEVGRLVTQPRCNFDPRVVTYYSRTS